MVGDACVRNSGSEDISLCLQILRHKTAIGGTHTTDLLGVDEGMFFAYLLRAFNNILCRSAPSRIHVARGPLLTKARSTTGLEDIGDITKRVPVLRRIG